MQLLLTWKNVQDSKKQLPCPTVSLSKSSEFNDVESVDLYIKPELCYLHIIEEFTEYSQAAIIKHKNESTKAFLTSWIGIFGVPSNLFSGKGNEFIGENFVELCEAFNIKANTLASYSP